MGLGERLKRLAGVGSVATGDLHPDGIAELQIGNPRFDDWESVREFGELETARAFRQQVSDAGIEAVITSDHPPDKWGRADIHLCVPPGKWSEAEELLGNYE